MRTDLLRRALVPVAALVALLLDVRLPVPAAVPGLLALAGLGLAAKRLVRLRRLGVVDGVLVVVGGVLVVVVLAGMAMGSTPVGLSPTTWVVALAVLSLVGLGLAARLPARPPAPAADGLRASRPATLRVLPWAALAVLVVVGCVRLSAGSLAEYDTEPVQLAFGEVSGTEVEVVVRSGEAVGPLELRTSDGTNETSYPLVDVAEEGTSTTTVDLPPTGRFEVTLSYPDQTQPLRTLVLDR